MGLISRVSSRTYRKKTHKKKTMIRILGPKSSACCAILSAWGIIFMVCLGGAFLAQSPALREDLAIDGEPTPENIATAYTATGTNCLMTSALYVVTLLFSLWQVHENNKSSPYLATVNSSSY